MIILSEASDQLPPSPVNSALRASTEIAHLLGFPIYFINSASPPNSALDHVPIQYQKTAGLWLGPIPSPEQYATLYWMAYQRGIRLLNSPEQHLLLQELNRSYPLLEGLTPLSMVLSTVDHCQKAIAQLGLPLFVRGAIHSRKQEGWSACVAQTEAELRHLVRYLLRHPELSRDRVIVRQLVPLRHHQRAANGFPLGREYRAFLYQQHLITYGYAWAGDDPLRYIRTIQEEETMLEVVYQAVARLKAPFVAIDVAQQENGQWIVIETSDPQFSGTGQIPLIQFWRGIRDQVK